MYFFTTHALNRLGERRITIEQVEECLQKGTLASTRYDSERECHVVSVYSGEPNNIIAVVAVQLPPIPVITVENVDWNEWDRSGKTIRRK